MPLSLLGREISRYAPSLTVSIKVKETLDHVRISIMDVFPCTYQASLGPNQCPLKKKLNQLVSRKTRLPQTCNLDSNHCGLNETVAQELSNELQVVFFLLKNLYHLNNQTVSQE